MAVKLEALWMVIVVVIVIVIVIVIAAQRKDQAERFRGNGFDRVCNP